MSFSGIIVDNCISSIVVGVGNVSVDRQKFNVDVLES